MFGTRRAPRVGVMVAVLAACSSVVVACTGDVGSATSAASGAGSTTVVTLVPTATDPNYLLTVNVELTDDGFIPPIVSLPQGKNIQLVLRNRGVTEHHYRVVNLIAEGLLWLAPGAELDPTGLSTEELANFADFIEHEAHHQHSFEPFPPTSPAGVTPIGTEVHGYAKVRGIDILQFVPVNAGVFEVVDVLHPEITGKVIVFTP